MRETACSSCSCAACRPARRFLIAAGLAQIVEYLEGLRFSADDLAYLKELHSVVHHDMDCAEGRCRGRLADIEIHLQHKRSQVRDAVQ
jgi:nicotinic acid phosphoribosyltransferase